MTNFKHLTQALRARQNMFRWFDKLRPGRFQVSRGRTKNERRFFKWMREYNRLAKRLIKR